MSRMLQAAWSLPALTRRLAADRRGVTAIITGITLSALMGFAGLAIDVSEWLNATRGLQAAADQAAYSAAFAAGTNGCASTSASTQAAAIAAARGYINGVNSTTVNTTCNSSASTFTVTISQTQPMWFANLFLSSPPQATADATARLAGKVSDLCVLALDGTNVAAAQVGSDTDAVGLIGNTTLNLHCGIADDSSSASAFAVGGSASVTATDVYLAGDDQGSPSGSATLTTSPTANNILRHQPPVEDPYLGRTIPTLTSCNYTNYSQTNGNTTTTLDPGVYCGGMTLGSSGSGHNVTINLNPGVYYVVGGTLTMDASVNLTGSGVTFVLTGNTLGHADYATLKVNAGASVSLTAPTSGATGGMVFFQDRNAPFSSNSTCGNDQAQNKIKGGSSQLLTGAVYFPNQAICFNGNSSVSGAGQCTQIIARTLDFTGTSDVKLSCAGSGITPVSVLVPQLIK